MYNARKVDPETESDKDFADDVENIVHGIFGDIIKKVGNTVEGPHDKVESKEDAIRKEEPGLNIESIQYIKHGQKGDKSDEVGGYFVPHARFAQISHSQHDKVEKENGDPPMEMDGGSHVVCHDDDDDGQHEGCSEAPVGITQDGQTFEGEGCQNALFDLLNAVIKDGIKVAGNK